MNPTLAVAVKKAARVVGRRGFASGKEIRFGVEVCSAFWSCGCVTDA